MSGAFGTLGFVSANSETRELSTSIHTLKEEQATQMQKINELETLLSNKEETIQELEVAYSDATELALQYQTLNEEIEAVTNVDMEGSFSQEQEQIQRAQEELRVLQNEKGELQPVFQEQEALVKEQEALAATVAQAGLVQATVTNIVDGDTIDVRIDGVTERVRFIGIDTPERREAGFNEATAFTRNAIANVGNVVWLESSGNNRDSFNRLRRNIWLEIPTDTNSASERSAKLLNQMLVDSGHAVVWVPRGSSSTNTNTATANANTNQASSGSERQYFSGIPVIPEAPTNFQNCTALRD